MKTAVNFKKLENGIRTFYLVMALAAIPTLSYLTFTHKEKGEVKTEVVTHVNVSEIKTS